MITTQAQPFPVFQIQDRSRTRGAEFVVTTGSSQYPDLTTEFVGSMLNVAAMFANVSDMTSEIPVKSLAATFSMRHILIGPILEGWRIIRPLLLTIEEEDGSYLISDDIFSVYGEGVSTPDALRDYQIALLDYYQIVARHAKKNAANSNLLEALQRYLQQSV